MALTGKPQVNKNASKATGVVYTPEHIVKYILARTLAKHDVVANPLPQVLDPACGTGNFLVAAYDLLVALFTEKLPGLQAKYGQQQYLIKTNTSEGWFDGKTYWQQENLHYHILRHCLYGADIDESAVSQAQRRLLEKNKERFINPTEMNLLVCDSLIKWETDQVMAAGGNNKTNSVLADFWRRQYDYVVGNPPYVSFGLNRVGKVTAVQADYLRANYPHSAQYKLSYYALFLERGLLALRPGGYLGYITPDSYLLGRYYSKIREFILDSCCIRELTLLNTPVFDEVVVGMPVISILQKDYAALDKAAVTVTVQKINTEMSTQYQYPQQYFCQQVYKRFRLLFAAEDKRIIDKLEQAPYCFGDVAKIRTGMRSLTVQADIKSKVKLGSTWQPGLISSSQVLPFELVYQGDWLDVDPVKLNKGGWDKTVIASPKIFLRQTGDKLIAAVDRHGYYHLNNIHSLALNTGELDLDYVVAILNSRLMNFYYQTVTLEKGRSLAQVDIEMVEKLPLVIDEQQTAALSDLAKQLADCGGYGAAGEGSVVYEKLNKLVYKLYGVSATDSKYIEDSNVSARPVKLPKRKE